MHKRQGQHRLAEELHFFIPALGVSALCYTPRMGKVIAGMTMSLDGYINDRTGSVAQLYADFSELHDVASFQEAINHTGAVVMGKHAFEMGDPDSWDAYEFQTPIFVVTHTPPVQQPKENDRLTFTFVHDGIERAIVQAKQAAGSKDVQIVGGARTIQQSLNTGLCDELHLDIVSVLLGSGRRLFEHIDTDTITLETIKVEATTSVRTSLVLRVRMDGRAKS